jgi:hypothetical protein
MRKRFAVWWSWKDYDAVVRACKEGKGPELYGIHGYSDQPLSRGGWVGEPPKGSGWVTTRLFNSQAAAQKYVDAALTKDGHENFEVREYTKADEEKENYWKDKVLW